MKIHATEPQSVREVRNLADLCLVPYLANTPWRTRLTVQQAKGKKKVAHHPGKFPVEIKKKGEKVFLSSEHSF